MRRHDPMVGLGGLSPTVNGRIRELAEIDAATVPVLNDLVATGPVRVDEQLKTMGALWT